jgi:nucleoside-diphosphate-sugar epimerase
VAQKLVELYPEKNLKVVFSNPSDEVKKGYVGYKIVQLDTSKLEKLGWSPKVELEDGMKRTVDYFEEEKKLRLTK